MKIKIEEKNAAAIEAALAAVNGRARTFTVTSYAQVAFYAAQVEKQLALSKLPKAERAGVKVSATPAGPDARAYKYVSTGTTIDIERGSSAWYLVGAHQSPIFPKQGEKLRIQISPAQSATIQANAVLGYYVSAPKTEEVGQC